MSETIHGPGRIEAFNAASARQTANVQQQIGMQQPDHVRARVQALEAEVRHLRQMIDGATIECSEGSVKLTWGE